MKNWFINTILVINLIIYIIGFYLKNIKHEKGEMIIGIAVLFMAIVLLPTFLYTRYKNKKIKDYLLDQKKLDQVINNIKDSL